MPAARFLIFCLLVIFVDQTDSSAGESNLTFNRINFKLGDKKDNNRTWGQNVSSGIINLYYASLDSKEYELDLIRVRATVTDGSSSFRSGLLQVTASNGRDSVALTVPQLYKNSDQWLNSAVRIMCPILGEDINKPNDATDGNPILAVSVMTTSIAQVHYDLYVDIYDRAQFFVRLPTKSKEEALSVTRNDKVAYNDPLAYRIDLRGYEIQQQPLKISVSSDDDICAVLAVQNFSCPLCQTAFDAIQTSLHLTFTRHAMLTIEPSTMLSNFTILFFVYPDDSPCGFHTTRNAIEKKKILVKFESERPTSYSWPILAFCLLFGAFYLVYFLETIVAKIRPMLKHQSPNVLSVRYHDDDGAEQISSQQIPPFLVNAEEARCADQQPCSSISKTELLLQLSSESGQSSVRDERAPSTADSSDLLSFGFEQPSTSRHDQLQRPRASNKSKLVASSHASSIVNQETTVSETHCIFDHLGYSGAGSKMSMLQSLMTEDSKQFQWHEILITLYTLPVVIQVAFTYFSWRLTSGNADICYHNFACARPLGVLASFNHVFSNFSYFGLGVLFLIFVSNRKSSIAKRLTVDAEPASTSVGTQQQMKMGVAENNGLLRAMGLAMVAESVGSALYHICPNSAAFQFDTPFIQVLIVLILLKLYAARHGATEAHWAFALIGVILVVDFAATAANHQQATKICLLVAHLLSVLFAEVQIYFGGHIDISVRRPMQSIKIMRKLIGTEISHKHYQPLFARRLIMLAFIFGVNALFAGYLFVIDPLNANMSVLSILVLNLIAYFAYYVVNKIISKETLSLTAWASLAAALLLWCAAAMFFTQKNTDWALAPAQSRALNKDCVLFDFFDAHDLWHVTSSMAAFFSLIAVAVIDDNQLTVPRSQISIF